MSLQASLVIARKEVVDHLRDRRSLMLGILYALMGPIFVGLILFARMNDAGAPAAQKHFFIMASVFALVAAVTGGMSVAMDVVAGERERRSLLPLLLSTRSRVDIVIGKWIAVSLYALAGVAISFIAFQAMFHTVGVSGNGVGAEDLLLLVPNSLSLALLAGAVEIFGSTMCRTLKEAQTWLSMAMFVVMGIGMAMAFRPQLVREWWFAVPFAGHQHILQLAFAREPVPMFETLALSMISLCVAALVLALASGHFHRDEIVYSG